MMAGASYANFNFCWYCGGIKYPKSVKICPKCSMKVRTRPYRNGRRY